MLVEIDVAIFYNTHLKAFEDRVGHFGNALLRLYWLWPLEQLGDELTDGTQLWTDKHLTSPFLLEVDRILLLAGEYSDGKQPLVVLCPGAKPAAVLCYFLVADPLAGIGLTALENDDAMFALTVVLMGDDSC
jgi:hypothetical protein